ncbi:MAG: hypothetical protein GX964_10545 [Syntrophomonadaceae bacterium]|nr:hypothetical protein [Syntrophomonadaceae bacterium]
MRKAAGTDFTPGQAQYLQDWVQDKLHRETETWKISNIRADLQQEPEMSRVEKLFWRLDRPLHGVAYVIFVAALLLMAWWVAQWAKVGGW